MYCVASGKQEKVQACLVTLWLFIISCHSLSKTTLGSLCSWKPAWSLKKRPLHIQCGWNPLWKCVSLWLSKSFGRYANIENNNDDDGDGDGDGDDDPCKNALTAPEPLLASAHSFSNISTILVLKNTLKYLLIYGCCIFWNFQHVTVNNMIWK